MSAPRGKPAEHSRRSRSLTEAVFRDLLDYGREVAIQILEFFDRCGMTVRGGDEWTIPRERPGMFDEAQY